MAHRIIVALFNRRPPFNFRYAPLNDRDCVAVQYVAQGGPMPRPGSCERPNSRGTAICRDGPRSRSNFRFAVLKRSDDLAALGQRRCQIASLALM
jgi:hypothetical protein